MRRKVERLVGSHYSSAVPGFGPKSFPRGRRGSHRSCGGSIGRAVAIYSEPTSAFMLRRALAPIAWNALFDSIMMPVPMAVLYWVVTGVGCSQGNRIDLSVHTSDHWPSEYLSSRFPCPVEFAMM